MQPIRIELPAPQIHHAISHWTICPILTLVHVATCDNWWSHAMPPLSAVNYYHFFNLNHTVHSHACDLIRAGSRHTHFLSHVMQYTTGVVLLESDCWGLVSSNTSLLANGSFDRPPAGPGLGTFAALEFLAAPTPLQP